GRLLVVEYNDEGAIIDHIILDNQLGNFACEIPARTWHSVISLEAGSVAYEVKHGPYNPIDDKNFASWAPKEGHPDQVIFNEKVLEQLGIVIGE
ncbi:MAG: WbuC family cupin fold metalloprotein, partial [Ignavibacteria bacterium]|nr:WbuC family cupin fold metalloprotein [Ignavibacteria bacterium]